MKRLIIMAMVKMVAKAILITIVVVILIGLLGYLNKWPTSVQYSDAFFIAGCLLIIAGTASRLGAGQGWTTYQSVHAESFRTMSAGDRANFIVNVSSSMSLVVLGVLSGILLMIISVLVTKIF